METPNSCLNSPWASAGIQTLNEELGAQMLCWSWAFGWKMLNLPNGPSGNDSREGFYCLHGSSWALSVEGKAPLKCSCLSCFSPSLSQKKKEVSFFTGTFITNKLKGCPCPGEVVRLHSLSIMAGNSALQHQKATVNCLSHKILFSQGEEACCLCLSAPATSLQASLTPAQSRGMRQDSQSSTEESMKRSELSTPWGTTMLTKTTSSSLHLLLPNLP